MTRGREGGREIRLASPGGLVVLVLALCGCDQSERAITGTRDRVREVHAGIEMREIATILYQYSLENNGRWPADQDAYQQVMRDAGIASGIPEDRYGTPYIYEPPASPRAMPRLLSAGKDQTPGTPDDVVHVWQMN